MWTICKQKYRDSEGPQKLMEASKSLMDDVYTRICDLGGRNSIFPANLFYHKKCFSDYIFKNFVELITNFLNKVRGMSILDMRGMINGDNPEIDMKNNELQTFFEEEFANKIQF